MSSNFINNLKGLIDFSGANPQLMATPSDIVALTGDTGDTISLEQATKELPRVSKSGEITSGPAGQKLKVLGKSSKVLDTTKNLNALFDNAVSASVKGVGKSGILNALKTAARPTSQIGIRGIGPVGAVLGTGMTIKDVYDLGRAMINNYNVNKDYDKQAYQEAQLRQMRRAEGASNAEIDAELEQLRAQKAASDAEVAKQQHLTDAAKASYEQALATQGNGSGMTPPPPTTPVIPSGGGDNIPPVEEDALSALPKTTLDYTNLSGLGNYSFPVGSTLTGDTAPVDYDPIASKFEQDILGTNEVANRERIMQMLNDNLAKTREVQARDPRYQGEILTPDNPYKVNTDKLRNLQEFEALANRVRQLQGAPQLENFAGSEINNARTLYQQQLANQAGVPYEDYIAATMEARANELTNLATERDNILKQQAAAATNMKEKIGYMQERYKLQQEYQKAMMENQIKGYNDLQKQALANRGTLDVAQTNAATDIAVQNMRMQDPARLMGGAASLGEALAFTPEMYRGQFLYNLPYSVKVQMGIQSLTPEQLQSLFAGRANQITPMQQRPTLSSQFNTWLNPQSGEQ